MATQQVPASQFKTFLYKLSSYTLANILVGGMSLENIRSIEVDYTTGEVYIEWHGVPGRHYAQLDRKFLAGRTVSVSMLEDRQDIQPDEARSVEYDGKYENPGAVNSKLIFYIDSHYEVTVEYHPNNVGGKSFYTVTGQGEGVQSEVCWDRASAVAMSSKVYGAPSSAEFEQLVDRLLVKE